MSFILDDQPAGRMRRPKVISLAIRGWNRGDWYAPGPGVLRSARQTVYSKSGRADGGCFVYRRIFNTGEGCRRKSRPTSAVDYCSTPCVAGVVETII